MQGTIHLRRLQFFRDFQPLPPYRRQFFTTIHRQIWQIFDPSPLKLPTSSMDSPFAAF